MNASCKQLPFSINFLALSIAIAHSHTIHASPVILDTDPFKDNVSTVGSNTEIDLTNTNHATLNWNSFDIGENESVIFKQQGSDSVAINNIIGGSATEILGSIEANGHIFLVNKNGFTFSKNASIDTQGFIATTFSTVFSSEFEDNQIGIKLNGTDTSNGSIVLNKLDVLNQGDNNTQYVAFYSNDIDLQGSITDNSLDQDSQITLQTGSTINESVRLMGLPINFSVNNQSIADSIIFGDSASINSNEGAVILSSSNLSSLLSANINLPNQISAKSLSINSNKDIVIDNEINTSTSNTIENIDIYSKNDIAVDNYIYGTQLNLSLNANNITIKEVVSSTDSSSYVSSFSYLGGTNGLNNISLTTNEGTAGIAGTITFSDTIKASSYLSINGNANIKIEDESQNIISLSSLNSINIEDLSLDSTFNVDLDIYSTKISTNSIKDFSGISISADDLTLNGTYSSKNLIKIDSFSKDRTKITFNDDTNFLSSVVNIRNADLYSNSKSLNFGNENNKIDNFTFSNIEMSEGSSAFENIILFSNENKDATISGKISVNDFSINAKTSNHLSISLNDDLYLYDVNLIDFGNTKILGTEFQFDINGLDNAIATIGDINTNGFTISNFKDLTFTGDSISVNDSNLTLDSESLKIINNTSFNSNEGKISISGNINANDKEVTIKSGTGGFSLNGISNANTIEIVNSSLTSSNKEHILSGNYVAINTITAENLGEVSVVGDSTFEVSVLDSTNSINLKGTQLNSQSDGSIISISAPKISLDNINAKDISINNNTTLDLYGNLTSSNLLTINSNDITLHDDITLTGNINFLDSDYTNKPNINSAANTNAKHLTINALNEVVHLYDIGNQQALAAFTLNGTGTLFMDAYPVIGGSLGLNILGSWDWTLDTDLIYTSDNQDLNLSGVNLNAVGTVSFDIGSGNLSLGTVGSNGTINELSILDAGVLSLYGDITLTDTKNGYDFSNTNSIMLYHDMTFGSENTPLTVNLGAGNIDGTYTLNIYSDNITMGALGTNIALQELNIYSSNDLILNNAINLVGNANISSNKLEINQDITSTGLDINLNSTSDIILGKDAQLTANYGNIYLSADTGNIGLSELKAKGNISINAENGYIFNVMNDYISNDLTSINVTSENLTLVGKQSIGQSVTSPIVIDVNSQINAESNGNIYLANLNNAQINSQGRIIDSASTPDTAILDAYNLFQLSSINLPLEPVYKTTLGLIEGSSWSMDDESTLKTIKTPTSSPNLYRTRSGWRLGFKY